LGRLCVALRENPGHKLTGSEVTALPSHTLKTHTHTRMFANFLVGAELTLCCFAALLPMFYRSVFRHVAWAGPVVSGTMPVRRTARVVIA
jgi:hypothetical protein